jgi:hypothetical protein
MKIKNLIIGAGISGLSFAYFLKNDDYLILEKDNTYGGYCRTIKKDGFTWDYAGHFYHFKTEELKKLFLDLVEREELIEKEKCTKIFYKDKLIDFPFQTHIHQLEKEEFIDCLYDLFTKEEIIEKDFLDMLYNKFGKSITEKFLKPYNEKLYATDLAKLDINAMGRFFPYADKDEIIKNMKKSKVKSYNANFWYLRKGTQYFIDKIYSKLNKDKILFNKEVQYINMKEKYVELSDGEKIYYDRLINTIPLNNALSMINGNENIVKEMSYNKVLVLNLGFKFKSKNFHDEHWLYFPDKNLNFYRVGFYNNILGSDKLSLYVEIGFDKNANINIPEEMENTLKNLEKVRIKDSNNELESYEAIIMNPAYVHINKYTQEKLDQILLENESLGFYTLGRYGKWTYNSMEDSMLWAKELADKLNSKEK